MKKIIQLLPFLLFSCGSAMAQSYWFQPQAAVLGGYTANLKSKMKSINAGYHFHNRSNHFGLELTNLFHLKNHIFIQSGFRYLQYQGAVSDLQSTTNLLPNSIPIELSWIFESFTVPVLIGKEFEFQNNPHAMVAYAGMSGGILMQSGIGSGGSSGESYLVQSEESENFQQSFFLAFEVGTVLAPFSKLPDLSIGLTVSAQLNDNTFYNSYDGVITNLQNNTQFPFSLSIKPQLLSLSLKAAYTFFKQDNRKQRRHKKGNLFSCPDV